MKKTKRTSAIKCAENATPKMISQLGIENRTADLLGWQQRSFDTFRRIVSSDDFPCFFSQLAFRRKSLKFVFAESTDSPSDLLHIRIAATEYLSQRKTWRLPHLSAFVVMFRPENLTLEEYHKQTWHVLQDFVDNDPHRDNRLQRDPELPGWTLPFAGEEWFFNSSNPAQQVRLSRNFGPSLTFVAKPRKDFDAVVGPHIKGGDKIRQMIRDRATKFDTQKVSSHVGDFHKGDSEWRGYCLFDDNKTHYANCPIFTG